MSIFNKGSHGSYLCLFLFGLVSSLAFAPTYLFFIFFLSSDYLLDVICSNKAEGYGTAFKIGWFFGFGYFIGNCYWYCSSLLVEPKIHAWLIPFAITIIPGYLALYVAATVFFVKYITEYTKNRFMISVFFSIFWTIFEYLRGILFTGFPWNIIGYSLSFSTLAIQTVYIFGSYIFSFFVILIYTSYWVLKDDSYGLYSLFYLLLIIAAILFSYTRLLDIENNKLSAIKIRLVQPNIAQEIKSSGDRREEIKEKLLDLSLKNSDGINYVIWPETTIPYGIFIDKNKVDLKYFGINFPSDKTLISGAIRIDRNDKKVFNSMIFLKNGKMIDCYDKNHLVPFGEYIPFRRVLPKFINSIAGDIDISKSIQKQRMVCVDENLCDISPIICYESIFKNLVNKKAKLIINITNDIWFGKTSGSYQHFETLKFRALENNTPVIRVANSGITGVIDRFGRVIAKTKLGTTAALDISLPEY